MSQAGYNRRSFLKSAPMAAVAGVALVEKGAVGEQASAPVPFQYFSAETLAGDAKALQASPGNNNLVEAKGLPFAVVMTTETAKSAKEFEWHEGRDHIVQIVEGSTVYEVGGTPRDGRNTKPGEWMAPSSEGARMLTLKKGDMLTVPRGTPHKRSTAGSVTFLLISPSGMLMG